MNRAILFVDGNNWYHSLGALGVDPAGIDLLRVAEKLVGPRQLLELRYYIGLVPQIGDPRLHSGQQRFLARLARRDPRISIHLGRIEPRPTKNKAAIELLKYLADLEIRIDKTVYQDLVELAKRHKATTVMVEKGVDVMLAVDLVVMAERDGFDTAYILSADGDYTHAAREARSRGKRVFAVSPSHGAQLAAAVDCFIHLRADWFGDCSLQTGKS